MSEEESGQVSEQEKEAIEDFKREYNDGRILKSDIIIELNTARIVNDLIDKLQKENIELKEELDYYKQKESQEFDERDYWEE